MTEPGSPEWEARVVILEVEESTQPLCVWYMSFAGESGWLGACLVRARGFVGATKEAHARGCNPGGEIKGAPMVEGFDPPSWCVNVLLSKEDMAKMDREVFDGDGEMLRWDEDQTPIDDAGPMPGETEGQ